MFKLRQIDRQYHLLHPGMRVLDLGAAPGSWSRYALERIQADSAWLCAVDTEKIDGVLQQNAALTFFRADFRSQEFCDQVRPYLRQGGLFDLVLSDMAPKTTGHRTVDTGRSEALAREVLLRLPDLLRAGGSLLFKLFQGGAEQDLQQELGQSFCSCRRLRPDAVRKQSFEVYFLCQGYQGAVSGPCLTSKAGLECSD